MYVPQEILQLICKHLERSDLKIFRLANKLLSDAANISLFRYIYLRRNMDSFCRLRMIASTPHLAKLVKGITYSGKMLDSVDEYTDFFHWRYKHFTQGCISQALDRLRMSYPTADLHRYYSKWCGHLHSQRLMQRFDIEEKELDDAFSKLSQLEEICFGPASGYLADRGEPFAREPTSSLGREMLVEPQHCNGLQYHEGQFTAMMAAAYKNKNRLKVIRALDVPRRTFQQHPEASNMMNTNMIHCERFSLKLDYPLDRVWGEIQVVSMLNIAQNLQAIELTFNSIPLKREGYAQDWSRVLDGRSHSTNLKTLLLDGFTTSERRLKGLLVSHATSLQSLDLARINLARLLSKGRFLYGSWVGVILFLRESLNLHRMHFRGYFTNQGYENWLVRDPWEPPYQDTPRVGGALTFQERVERYVVEGGEFPLPWPTEAEDQTRWRQVLRGFRPALDETWNYRDYHSAFFPN